MKIQNIFTKEIIASSQIVEYDDYFMLQKSDLYKWETIQFPKTSWLKIKDDAPSLKLILKDFNSLHRCGFDAITERTNDEYSISFLLFSKTDKVVLLYDKKTERMYFQNCEIQSEDLKASIKGYLDIQS